MSPFWKILTNIMLIISIFSGCAAIPGKNIKLENYPEIKGDLKDLNLDFRYFNSVEKLDEYHQFDKIVGENLRKHSVQKSLEDHNHGCTVKVSTKSEVKEDGFCEPYFAVTFFTLFIVPFYCQEKYQANASLISYSKETETRGHEIKLSINQAKLGDFFLDENDRPAKLLKTYELKDKVHEIWSSLWMLSWFVVDSWGKGPTPEKAKYETENTISEALVRQVIHDASQFEECKKSSSPIKKK